ncbi:hypothetical protein EDD37DRAFT_119469 [Exophiala viscosa]|uniref:uncharacterized protein n=1 Tax=Exophiala viscosa TaxID=2486360 RepID=UPI00219278A7|nr:hypothetical protein EDD37DRAFT_119469 [Exophiala viscosa]
MGLTADPFYNRKPVPDELIRDVGVTGLSPDQEYWNRERKYSVTGGDIRKFSSSKKGGLEPQDDPYYGRKRISNAEIHDIGATGLTPEQEYLNRERKYSVTGVDVRKFSTSKKGGMEPANDPYYNRKKVSNAEISGVGQTDMTPAEQYEVRERKQSLFQLSDDPFAHLAGRNRTSISGVASGASAAASRRRSSAVAPDAHAPSASHTHSGYQGHMLAPIESRPEPQPFPGPSPVNFGDTGFGGPGRTGSISTSDTLTKRSTAASAEAGPSTHSHATGSTNVGGHTAIYDAVTMGHDHNEQLGQDPDHIAPHEVR